MHRDHEHGTLVVGDIIDHVYHWENNDSKGDRSPCMNGYHCCSDCLQETANLTPLSYLVCDKLITLAALTLIIDYMIESKIETQGILQSINPIKNSMTQFDRGNSGDRHLSPAQVQWCLSTSLILLDSTG